MILLPISFLNSFAKEDRLAPLEFLMPNGDPCRGVVKTLAAPLEFLNAEFDGDPRREVVKTLAAPLEFLKAEFGGDPRRGVVETLGGEMCVITGQGSHQSRYVC